MPAKDVCIAILVAAIWGINFIFIKLGVQEVPPLFLCAMRFFFAGFPAVFFIKWPTVSHRMIILYGLIMFALQFSLIFCSLAVGMTAGMASLLSQVQIFFSMFFAMIFLEERPSIGQLLGASVAFTGIVLVSMHINGTMTLAGFVLILCAAAVWGLGNLISKKIANVGMMTVIVYGSLIACLPLLCVSYLVEGPTQIINSLHHITWIAVISLAYIVIASTWLGYGLWNTLLSRHPVITVVPFTLLVPVFGIATSALFLDEKLDRWKIIASILVISGIAINLITTRGFLKYKNRYNKN